MTTVPEVFDGAPVPADWYNLIRTLVAAHDQILTVSGHGLVYGKHKVDNGDLVTAITTETTMFSKTVTLEVGRSYRVQTLAPTFSSVANDTVRIRIKDGTSQVAESGEVRLPPNAFNVLTIAAETNYKAAVTSVTFNFTVTRITGTGTITVRGFATEPFEVYVADVGDGSLIEA